MNASLVVVILFLKLMLSAVYSQKSTAFFGRHSSDGKNIESSLDFAYEKFRKDMTMSLQRIWQFLNEIEKMNRVAPELSAVHEDFRQSVIQLPRLWECNDDIVNQLVMHRPRYLIQALQQEQSAPHFLHEEFNRSAASYDSFPQLLGHLARDWSDVGAATRDKIYKNGILKSLELNSVAHRNNLRVLVPGAGIGRLAVEIAAMGYRWIMLVSTTHL
jgi:hypothetical protein